MFASLVVWGLLEKEILFSLHFREDFFWKRLCVQEGKQVVKKSFLPCKNGEKNNNNKKKKKKQKNK